MDIRIPNLGEGADGGTVVNIFVKEGDRIAKGQTLLELENEKAVAPIPSTQAGVVKKIHVKTCARSLCTDLRYSYKNRTRKNNR